MSGARTIMMPMILLSLMTGSAGLGYSLAQPPANVSTPTTLDPASDARFGRLLIPRSVCPSNRAHIECSPKLCWVNCNDQ